MSEGDKQMSSPIARSCFEPRQPTPNDLSSFEQSTREFHHFILTIDPADIGVADREGLRVLLQNLLVLAQEP